MSLRTRISSIMVLVLLALMTLLLGRPVSATLVGSGRDRHFPPSNAAVPSSVLFLSNPNTTFISSNSHSAPQSWSRIIQSARSTVSYIVQAKLVKLTNRLTQTKEKLTHTLCETEPSWVTRATHRGLFETRDRYCAPFYPVHKTKEGAPPTQTVKIPAQPTPAHAWRSRPYTYDNTPTPSLFPSLTFRPTKTSSGIPLGWLEVSVILLCILAGALVCAHKDIGGRTGLDQPLALKLAPQPAQLVRQHRLKIILPGLHLCFPAPRYLDFVPFLEQRPGCPILIPRSEFAKLWPELLPSQPKPQENTEPAPLPIWCRLLEYRAPFLLEYRPELLHSEYKPPHWPVVVFEWPSFDYWPDPPEHDDCSPQSEEQSGHIVYCSYHLEVRGYRINTDPLDYKKEWVVSAPSHQWEEMDGYVMRELTTFLRDLERDYADELITRVEICLTRDTTVVYVCEYSDGTCTAEQVPEMRFEGEAFESVFDFSFCLPVIEEVDDTSLNQHDVQYDIQALIEELMGDVVEHAAQDAMQDIGQGVFEDVFEDAMIDMHPGVLHGVVGHVFDEAIDMEIEGFVGGGDDEMDWEP